MTAPTVLRRPEDVIREEPNRTEFEKHLSEGSRSIILRYLDRPPVAVSLLIALGVVLPAVVAWSTGSFGVPWNDDWTYRNVASEFFRTGHFRYGGWSSMILIGQVLWSWPFLRLFGDHAWVFSVSTMFLASGGIVAAYYLARQVLAPRRSFGAVGLLVLLPGMALSTDNFMTDVPSLSVTLICVALGIAAVKSTGGRHWTFLLGSVVFGLWAFSFREFTLPGPVAVLVVAGFRARRRLPYLGLTVLFLVLCSAIYDWSEHVPGMLNIPIEMPSAGSLTRVIQAYFTLSLMLSPAIAVFTMGRRQVPKYALVLGLLVFSLAAACFSFRHGLFVGNYFETNGMVQPVLSGNQGTLFSTPVWDLISLVAAAFGSLLAMEASARALENQSLPRLGSMPASLQVINAFALLSVAGIAAYGLVTPIIFDRYLWPSAFILGVLLLKSTPSPRQSDLARRLTVNGRAFVAAGIMLGVLTVILSINADTFLSARWRAGHVATAHGIPAAEVDAGIEWLGSNNVQPVDMVVRTSSPPYESSNAQVHPGFRDCAVVSASPLRFKGLHLLTRVGYERYGFFGEGQLFVYSTDLPACRL